MTSVPLANVIVSPLINVEIPVRPAALVQMVEWPSCW